MDKSKTKSLLLSKLKISEVGEGIATERRVTFVASTANEDRDYEKIDIGSFRLPIKGGGEVLVRDLTAEGSDNVDIPMLTNHDLWEVEKTIGSVRRAKFEDGKLIFEAGISSRPYAQDVFKLIEEGHLDNAFSIQFRDYDYNFDTKVITGGEIVEVSLVTRGSNKDAQVLEVKALKGENMATADAEPTNTEVEAPATETSATPDKSTQNETNQTVDTPQAETAEGATPTEEKPEAESKEKAMTTETNHKEIAVAQAKMPSQTASVTKAAPSDYLKSKQAEHDFAMTIVENFNKPSQLVMKAWRDKVAAKGITGDAILPSNLEQIFFKGWEDHYEAIGTFRRTTRLAGAMYAFNTTDRAQGHRKGDKKAEQTLNDIRRDYKALIAYKKLGIDLQDLIDDESGELLRLRSSELSTRTDDEIVRAAVMGDGRTKPTGNNPDYHMFNGTRGLWSMKTDIDNSDSTDTANAYAAAVATKIANVTSDGLYQKIIKVRGAIRGGAGRKIIFVPEGSITELLLATKDNGEPLFAPGTDFQDLFGVYIFESPYMEGSGYDVIGYREGSYLLAMGDLIVRGAFDLDYNRDVLLHERAVAGTLFGHKVAAGYQSKA